MADPVVSSSGRRGRGRPAQPAGALNALSDELMDELVSTLMELDRDKAVRAIVLGGSERAFAAGADIGELAQVSAIELYYQRRIERWDAIRALWTPLVAAVSGYCLGGGCELAMSCDLIVASETAQFGQPETGLGIIPGAGGTQRLTRAVGKALAMDVILSGRRLSAQRGARRPASSRAWSRRRPGSTRRSASRARSPRRDRWPRGSRRSRSTAPSRSTLSRRPRGRAAGALPRVRERGRKRGPDGLHREAPARVQGPLSRLAGSWPDTSATRALARDRPSRLALELGRHELQLELPAFAQHPHRHRGADPLHHHQALDVVHARDRRAVELDDQVLGSQPAAAAGVPSTTWTTSTPASRPSCRASRGGSGRAPPAIPR